MVRPEYFRVDYSINPWMHPDEWKLDYSQLAQQQWNQLKGKIEDAGGKVIVEHGQPDCPDMCFVANAGVVLDNKALASSFVHPERQTEEARWYRIFYKSLFIDNVYFTAYYGRYIPFEGAGDCLWDSTRKTFWLGHGIRSDIEATAEVIKAFHKPVKPLQLIDPRFYHLDMAMCILPHGEILNNPEAFDTDSRKILSLQENIFVSEADALAFACNLVAVNDSLIVNNGISEELFNELTVRGYTVIQTDFSAFIKAGGAASCLTLRLDNKS
jgi:N-dimethylarginine dimethylaminohydrolase